VVVYMVECGFAAGQEDLEARWNTWYSGHQKDFLTVKEFLTTQRFIAIGSSFPKYRAMYTLESQAAFESPVYKGFSEGVFPIEWRGAITNFHRNVFDSGTEAPKVDRDSCLVVVDNPDSSSIAGVPLKVWNAVGLDKSVATRGIAVVKAAKGAELDAARLPRVSVYTLVTEQIRQP
jgi:hypothetical protein